MLRLAKLMAARQRAALIAVAFAVLGGTALFSAAGVLVQSGLQSHLPVTRLERADVVVSADQLFHVDGNPPIALPERRGVPGALVVVSPGCPAWKPPPATSVSLLIGLRTEAGATDSLAAAVRTELDGSGLVVTTGAARGDGASPGATAAGSLLVLLASSLAGIMLLVVGFVVAGAMAVSIASQRQDLLLLRIIGVTPRQVRALVASEAGVAAAIGLIPGMALGYLAAAVLRRWLADLGVVPSQLPLTIGPLPALAPILLLSVTVYVAASAAAWRVSWSMAGAAFSESRAESRQPLIGRARTGALLMVTAAVLAAAPWSCVRR